MVNMDFEQSYLPLGKQLAANGILNFFIGYKCN